MLKKTVLFFCCVATQAVFAADFSNWGTITQTYTSNSWTMVTVTGDPKNPDACASSSLYALNVADTNYEGMLSTILAAQMGQKSVRFWLSGCSGQSGSYPRIVSVQMNS
jgi:hypothetical protein